MKASRTGPLASTFSSRNKNIKNRESFQTGEQDQNVPSACSSAGFRQELQRNSSKRLSDFGASAVLQTSLTQNSGKNQTIQQLKSSASIKKPMMLSFNQRPVPPGVPLSHKQTPKQKPYGFSQLNSQSPQKKLSK